MPYNLNPAGDTKEPLTLRHSWNLLQGKVADPCGRTGEQQNAAGVCGGECASLFGEKPDASLEFQRTREFDTSQAST